MQRENGNKNVGQAMPDSKGNSFWKNEIRLIIRQAEPDLRVTTTNAFTLIELLVVVLIIGILAAVAVPQYQMAVWKSRLSTVKALSKNIANAEEVYYLANGKYTSDLSELAVTGSEPVSASTATGLYSYSWGKCLLETGGANQWVECILYNQEAPFMAYEIKLDHSSIMTSTRICVAYGSLDSTDNTLAQRVCKRDTNNKKSVGGCGSGSRGDLCFWYY